MLTMNIESQINEMQEAIDVELKDCISELLKDYPAGYISLINYQLGWEGEQSGKIAQGKRIRPLLVLLTCQACGGNWKNSLPAAAAVELLHNFSLIHDDIQDHSEIRRGRKTVWVKWGDALAINTGDALLACAQLSLYRMEKNYPPEVISQASKILQTACLNLTRGQYLDISYEKERNLFLDLYWQMIDGKTSSLLSACFSLGALLGGADEILRLKMTEFGSKLGLAFQVQDDWLGIWGNDFLTGKSVMNDLITRKKTYPILLGIQNRDQFANKWDENQEITPGLAKEMAQVLVVEGGDQDTVNKYNQLYQESFSILNSLSLREELLSPLRKVVESLLGRMK